MFLAKKHKNLEKSCNFLFILWEYVLLFFVLTAGIRQEPKKSTHFEEHKWKNALKKIYSNRGGEIKFGCHRTSVADTESIFVDLELLPEGNDICRKHFESYEDLFTINKKEERCLHILLRGHAGTGKSTLVSRLAYKWATLSDADEYKYLDMFQLVITLDVRKFRPDENLQQAIQCQLLNSVSVEYIAEELTDLTTKCLYLVDGFDEISQKAWENETHVFDSPLLADSFIIITTRPHMVDRFCERYSIKCAHVYLSGFSPWHVHEYVKKFFIMHDKQNLAESLSDKIMSVPLLKSTFPILLLMLCHLWLDQECDPDLPESLTELYYEAIEYLNKHWLERYEKDKHNVLLELGHVAIDKLFEGKLTFDSRRLRKECIDDACAIGLVYKEEMERHRTGVTFIHKTFHEFCAAFYWSNLAHSNVKEFNTYLKQINTNNISDMEYLLRFCCGHNTKAACVILNQVMKSTYTTEGNFRLPLILLNEATSQYKSKPGQQYLEEFSNLAVDTYVNYLYIGPQMYEYRKFQCKLSSLFVLLAYLPSVKEIKLTNVNISHRLNNLNKSEICKSLTVAKIDVEECTIGASTLLLLLSCMTLLKELTLNSVAIEELKSDMSVTLRPLTKFEIKRCTIDANTLLDMLSAMPSLKELHLDEITIEKSSSHMSVVLKSLTYFQMTSCTMRVDIYQSMLSGMPSLQELKFSETVVKGGHSDYYLSVVLQSLIRFDMAFCKVRANVLLAMLSGMPSLRMLTLFYIELGELDSDMHVVLESLERFDMTFSVKHSEWRKKRIRASTLLGMLSVMPSLQILSFSNIEVEQLDSDMHVLLKSLTIFDMSDSTIRASTLLAMLSGMPSLQILSFSSIEVGQLDSDKHVVLNSLTIFDMSHSTIRASILLTMLSGMPSLQVLKLYCLNISKSDSDMLVVLKSLTQFDMDRCRTSANTLLAMLSGLSSFAKVTIKDVEMEGEAGVIRVTYSAPGGPYNEK